MNPNHDHVYRHQKEADRIIKLFALRPSPEVREMTRQSLLRQKENLLRERQANDPLPLRRRDRSKGRDR